MADRVVLKLFELLVRDLVVGAEVIARVLARLVDREAALGVDFLERLFEIDGRARRVARLLEALFFVALLEREPLDLEIDLRLADLDFGPLGDA